MRVYIYACDSEYQGLHGIYEAQVEELKTWDEICEWGNEMAEDVLSSYGRFEYNEDEWENEDEYIEEREESKMWRVYKILDEVALSIEELNDEIARLGDEDFEEKYCDRLFDVYEAMKESK